MKSRENGCETKERRDLSVPALVQIHSAPYEYDPSLMHVIDSRKLRTCTSRSSMPVWSFLAVFPGCFLFPLLFRFLCIFPGANSFVRRVSPAGPTNLIACFLLSSPSFSRMRHFDDDNRLRAILVPPSSLLLLESDTPSFSPIWSLLFSSYASMLFASIFLVPKSSRVRVSVLPPFKS